MMAVRLVPKVMAAIETATGQEKCSRPHARSMTNVMAGTIACHGHSKHQSQHLNTLELLSLCKVNRCCEHRRVIEVVVGATRSNVIISLVYGPKLTYLQHLHEADRKRQIARISKIEGPGKAEDAR